MQTIERQELRRRLDEEDILLLDVRGDDEYETEHIPGAKTAPLGSLQERVEGVVNPGTDVAVYSGGAECDASDRAAQRLQDIGFRNVYDYHEGLAGWKDAGLETVRRR